MRTLVLSLLAAGLVLMLGSALAADEVKDELKKLDGVWTPTEGEAAGQALQEDDLKKMKLTLKDGKFDSKVGDDSNKGNLKIDPKKKPKEVDVEAVEGSLQGRTFKAIYELDKDTLKVC